MRLSWNEVRARAAAFAEDWADAGYERGETQSFYNDFFQVFGVKRRQVATFEEPVKKLGDRQGFIDLFWKGKLLVEQKSAGKNRVRAKDQALEYFPGLKPYELPRYVLVSDFQTFDLYDLETDEAISFRLSDLPEHVQRFGFVMGLETRVFREQDKANILASELMAKVHDGLAEGGYDGHNLERYLVRLLFCLFADDTGIFEPDTFQLFIEQRTREDGSDLGPWLDRLWQVLDTPPDKRPAALDDELRAFPYVNGELFRERLPTADFGSKGRERLLEACGFRWQEISPAIFGSLFQGVMNAKERRKKGAHYTTETNILKVIQPLFLDELRAEFEKIKTLPVTRRRQGLDAFQGRLAGLTFLDPACGCGNFLVVTYRELRRLETEALVARFKSAELTREREGGFSVASLSKLNVDRFHGIELEEFPARIAEVAMWMTDHIENNRLSLEFGEAFARIPLTTAPHIVHGDALEIDWTTVLRPEACSYVLGNPPFIGAKYQSDEQRAQVRRIAGLGGSGGTLDYVAAWFIKAGDYAASATRSNLEPPPDMTDDEARRWNAAVTGELLAPGLDLGTPVEGTAPAEPSRIAEAPAPRIGFVSTNSITQGEQVAQLWPLLFRRHRLEIAFAHRTFAWGSDARGKAHVHVVIIGLARRGQEPAEKRLFSYDDINGDPLESQHTALTAYLFGAETVADRHLFVRETTAPLSPRQKVIFGNMPNDGGHLILSSDERASVLASEPEIEDMVKLLLGAKDSIDGNHRYCFWLVGVSPDRLRRSALIKDRVRKVRDYRSASTRTATQALAETPTLFGEIRHTGEPYILVPRHPAESRDYVPFSFNDGTAIAHDSCLFMPGARVADFGVITSRMHMAWLSHIGGRIKSDYRYSVGVVYNTFPWPRADGVKRGKVEKLAQAVLDARAAHPGATLADLYDPDLMPPDLRKAHRALDEAVDRLYRPAPFGSDRERAEHLFGLYERMTAGLLATPKTTRRRKAA